MKWLDRLLGRSPSEAEEHQEDKRAIRDLRDSFRKVRIRTERIIEDAEQAEKARRNE